MARARRQARGGLQAVWPQYVPGALRHPPPWKGEIKCDNPARGVGRSPAGVAGNNQPKPATDLAFAPRGKVKLAQLVAQDIPEVDVKPAADRRRRRASIHRRTRVERGFRGREEEEEEGVGMSGDRRRRARWPLGGRDARAFRRLPPAALCALIGLAAFGCSRGELGIAAVSPTPAPLAWQLPAEAGRFAPAHHDRPGVAPRRVPRRRPVLLHLSRRDLRRATGPALTPGRRLTTRLSVLGRGRPRRGRQRGLQDVRRLPRSGAAGRRRDGSTDRARRSAGPHRLTCRVCHGLASATADGNGSVTIAAAAIPLPKGDDPVALEAPQEAARPVRTTAGGLPACGSCHRGFLSEATGNRPLLDRSGRADVVVGPAWSGNGLGRIDAVEPKTCVDCHMPEIGGRRSHRFAGGHTWLAAMLGDRDQLAAQRAMLEGAASIDVAGCGSARSGTCRPTAR